MKKPEHVFKSLLTNPAVFQVATFDANLKNFPDEHAVYVIQLPTGFYYVGGTRTLKRRLNQHRCYLRAGNHINQQLQLRYTEAKENEITVYFAVAPDKVIVKMFEQALLDELHGQQECLNVSSGANGTNCGYDRTAALIKLSQTKSSAENRAKASASTKERWQNPVMRKALIRALGENVTVDGVDYGSVREASRATGKSISALRRVLKDGKVDLTKVLPFRRPVVVNGVEYKSLEDAAKICGIASNTLHWRINNKKPHWDEYRYGGDLE
jgi:hypothetical protein